MKFGEIIKSKRLHLGLTQKDVAKKLNVSRQSVSKWELGKSFPDLSILILLSDFYHLSLENIIKGEANIAERNNYFEWIHHLQEGEKIIVKEEINGVGNSYQYFISHVRSKSNDKVTEMDNDMIFINGEFSYTSNTGIEFKYKLIPFSEELAKNTTANFLSKIIQSISTGGIL